MELTVPNRGVSAVVAAIRTNWPAGALAPEQRAMPHTLSSDARDLTD